MQQASQGEVATGVVVYLVAMEAYMQQASHIDRGGELTPWEFPP